MGTVFQGKDVEVRLDNEEFSNHLVSCANSMTFDVETGTEGKRGIHEGRKVNHFKRGRLEITGTIDKAWATETLVDEVTTDDEHENVGTFDIYCQVEKNGDEMGCKIEDCVFTAVSPDFDAEDISEISLEFEGTDIDWGYHEI